MGRYIIEPKDKAAELEVWFEEQVETLKKELKGAEILEAKLYFVDPYTISGETFNKGFASMFVKVADRGPKFLNERDGKIFCRNLVSHAMKEFGIIIIASTELSHTDIIFSEPTEEALYVLTENKKELFRVAFQNIKNYVSWHRACAKRYRDIVVEAHEKALQSYFKNHINV